MGDSFKLATVPPDLKEHIEAIRNECFLNEEEPGDYFRWEHFSRCFPLPPGSTEKDYFSRDHYEYTTEMSGLYYYSDLSEPLKYQVFLLFSSAFKDHLQRASEGAGEEINFRKMSSGYQPSRAVEGVSMKKGLEGDKNLRDQLIGNFIGNLGTVLSDLDDKDLELLWELIATRLTPGKQELLIAILDGVNLESSDDEIILDEVNNALDALGVAQLYRDGERIFVNESPSSEK